MLVVTRGIHERLILDGDIVVEVLSVRDGNVKLGITAPADVDIWRSEVAPPAAEAACGEQGGTDE